MDFTAIFTAYWNLYRSDSDIPASTDEEYTVGLRLANEAVKHWATYDGTLWKQLLVNLQASGEGVNVVTSQTDYDAPEDFNKPAGDIFVLDSTTNKTKQVYHLIDPSEAQFKNDDATYAYFTGSPAEGYVLNLNPAPTSTLNGHKIDYWYYKTPTEFSTGTDITEMNDAYFVVHRMLANRYRASRNPFYSDALRDSENSLAKMKMENDAGSWSQPYSVKDRSGSQWGQ